MTDLTTALSRIRFILVPIAAVFIGCDGKKEGPKWEDHKAAHKPVYHPDVARTQAKSPAETRPAEVGAITPDAQGEWIGRPVLEFNGGYITDREILEPLYEDLKTKARLLTSEAYVSYLRGQVIQQLRDRQQHLVVYEEARKLYSSEQAETEFKKKALERIEKIINRRYGGIKARYEAHLRELGFSLKDMEDRALRELMVETYLNNKFRPTLTEPSRRQLKRYYDQHIEDFTTKARAELWLIEIPLVDDRGRALPVDEQRGRADNALQELRSGIDFAAVAKTYSNGPRARLGGKWGDVAPGEVSARLEKPVDVLFTLQAGQHSNIVETEEALFIVRCRSIIPSTTTSFENAQEQIIEEFLEEQFRTRINTYVADLMRQASVPQELLTEFVKGVMMAAPWPTSESDGLSRK